MLRFLKRNPPPAHYFKTKLFCQSARQILCSCFPWSCILPFTVHLFFYLQFFAITCHVFDLFSQRSFPWKICYDMHQIMSPSMHHIKYSSRGIMRIINTSLNTCNRNKYGQCTRFPPWIGDIEITTIAMNDNSYAESFSHTEEALFQVIVKVRHITSPM